MRILKVSKVKGHPTRLLIEVADSPKNIAALTEPNKGALPYFVACGSKVTIQEE